MTLLECKHLTKTFDRKTVLDDVSLKIEPGKIYGLLFTHADRRHDFIQKESYRHSIEGTHLILARTYIFGQKYAGQPSD